MKTKIQRKKLSHGGLKAPEKQSKAPTAVGSGDLLGVSLPHIHLDLWNFYVRDGKIYLRLFSAKPGDEPGRIGLTPKLLADFVKDVTFIANEPTWNPQRERKQSGVDSAVR